jgi:hypothetical protein
MPARSPGLAELRFSVFYQAEGGALGNLRVMMKSGSRGCLRDVGAETRLGFEPVIRVAAIQGAVLNVKMIGVVANLIFGRLWCDGGV